MAGCRGCRGLAQASPGLIAAKIANVVRPSGPQIGTDAMRQGSMVDAGSIRSG
jgi:hypothetical protein